MDTDKRRFQRIPFNAHISLEMNQAASVISGTLQDISLKGALIVTEADMPIPAQGDTGELRIQPEQGDLQLTLKVEVAYRLPERHAYGLNLLSMDVESAAHLRRLIEVNLGDEASLQRELANLIEAMEQQHASKG